MKLSAFGLLLLLSSCSVHHLAESDLFNQQVALPSHSPVPLLEWKVISSSVDRAHQTMSTLTGNDLAVQKARQFTASPYPNGATLALATWSQRPDPHWFGAMIPGPLQSIETVSVTENGSTYQKYAGNPLTEVRDLDPVVIADRKNAILTEQASIMP